MQPTVIIPTFWTKRRPRATDRGRVHFDHPTLVGEDGPLPGCLRSLASCQGLERVIVVVAAADDATAMAAEDQVRELLADMVDLETFVFGPAELGSLHRRMEQMEFADLLDGINLSSYGGARNAGLAMAAALGSEAVVFVDDDQIVTGADFLLRGMQGLGEVDAQGRPVLAKSGYYIDDSGRSTVDGTVPLSDTFWRQSEFYNRAIAAIAKPPRIKPSSIAFGGCMALHRDMYCSVPFDPWAVRGEDIDYVIDVRMHGGDMFVDGEWSIVHRPPEVPSEALLFRHDVYRFVYTHRKLEFSKSQVDLRQVTPDSLMPYPGHLVDASIGWRARTTAVLRGLAGRERSSYFHTARSVVPEAQRYARANCERYFSFQRRWPMLTDRLWNDIPLQSLFTGERSVDRGALTGRFPSVRTDESR